METKRTDSLSTSERAPSTVERKYPRFGVNLPCLFSKENGPDWNGTAIDLSRGGCAIHSSARVQKGDYLQVLIFPFPDHAPIKSSLAPVRWATSEFFGVEFITLTPRDAKRLEGYLMLMDSDMPTGSPPDVR